MKLYDVMMLSNEDLLELFELYVRTNHYDQFTTPEQITDLRENGVGLADVRSVLLERLG